jgi:hypothetical protein
MSTKSFTAAALFVGFRSGDEDLMMRLGSMHFVLTTLLFMALPNLRFIHKNNRLDRDCRTFLTRAAQAFFFAWAAHCHRRRHRSLFPQSQSVFQTRSQAGALRHSFVMIDQAVNCFFPFD